MDRAYAWMLEQVSAGRTVLVYAGVTARSAKHVRSADRICLRDGVVFIDEVSARGMTICLKP